MSVKTVISIVISFLISVINTILGMVLRTLSYKEKYETKTSYNISLAKRIAFAQFLNTGILIVLTNILIHGDGLKDKIWSDKGLSNDAAFIMVFNIFSPPLSSFLDPFFFLRLWKRR